MGAGEAITGRSAASSAYRCLAYTDPFGLCPEWVDGKPCDLNAVASLAAGFGDAVSFGATDWLRDKMGTNDVVDKDGAAYFAGQVTGVATSAALGGAVAKTIREGGVIATSAPARTVGKLVVEAGEKLLGRAGTLNKGGVLRIGVGKLGGGTGRAVLRVAGSAVKGAAGVDHINLVDLGTLAQWFH